MKCQKCAKPAIVHLTEIVTEPGVGGFAGGMGKRTVEIHLCLDHAVEAGLIVPNPGVPPQMLAIQSPKSPGPTDHLPPAMIPVNPGVSDATETSLALARDRNRGDLSTCPTCGMNWAHFKQAGLMGCPHDYDLFSLRLLPLLKRAQEGATEHLGKVPPRRKSDDTEKRAATIILRRELQKAIDAEKYEDAATLRDQLRHLQNPQR